jgi:hypothetical protein
VQFGRLCDIHPGATGAGSEQQPVLKSLYSPASQRKDRVTERVERPNNVLQGSCAPFHGVIELPTEWVIGSYEKPMNVSTLPEMRRKPKGT